MGAETSAKRRRVHGGKKKALGTRSRSWGKGAKKNEENVYGRGLEGVSKTGQEANTSLGSWERARDQVGKRHFFRG